MEETKKKPSHEYFQDSQCFMEGLAQSQKWGLEAEFVADVFQQLPVTKEQIENAVGGALGEWDL